MSRVMEKEDHREQLLLDSELLVTWKLTCGAIAGATAQSGEQNMASQTRRLSASLWMSDSPGLMITV